MHIPDSGKFPCERQIPILKLQNTCRENFSFSHFPAKKNVNNCTIKCGLLLKV